ncbi:MAG TPA: MFS transporter [Novosphingobium sp.]|nr:MFS transporter [Novosphingobium sp.]
MSIVKRMDPGKMGVLIACVAGNCVNGLVAGSLLSIALVPLSREFGWQRSTITGVGAMVGPINILLPVLIGWLADRLGARRILILGNVGFALSLAAASMMVPNIFLFYANFAIISILGHVTGPLLFGKVIAGWFDGRRGTAMGLVAGLGNGLCTIVFPILAAVLLSHFGWRGAYLGTAAVVFLVGFPPMFLLLRDPPRGTLRPEREVPVRADSSLQAALRSPTYWMLAIAMTLGSGCMLSVLSHTVPALTDRGFTLSQAVPVVTCISLVGMIAQASVGAMLDRARHVWFAAPLYAASVMGIQLILHGGSMPVLLAGGALLGVGVGTEFAVLPILISRYFGVANYGKIAGATYSGIMLAGGLFPFLLDRSFDRTGSYAAGFQTMQIALALGALLICCLPSVSRRDRAVAPVRGAEPLLATGHSG